jgi:hypothetical protein
MKLMIETNIYVYHVSGDREDGELSNGKVDSVNAVMIR